MYSKRLLLIFFILGCIQSVTSRTIVGGNADCGSKRVRKNVDKLPEKDLNLLKRCLARVMKSGVYDSFVQMHSEKFSNTQAHKSELAEKFGIWHLMLLLALENAVRAADEECRCLTIPYAPATKIVADADPTGANKPFVEVTSIVHKMCGLPILQSSATVYGETCSGSLSTGYPCDQLCSYEGAPANCLKGAMRRSDMATAKVFLWYGIGKLNKVFSESKNMNDFTKRLQSEYHNALHMTIGSDTGHMARKHSPRDPLFYVVHSSTDHILQMFQECKRTSPNEADFQYKKTNVEMTFRLMNGTHAKDTPLSKYFPFGFDYNSYTNVDGFGDFKYEYEYDREDYSLILDDNLVCPGLAPPKPEEPTTNAPGSNTTDTTESPTKDPKDIEEICTSKFSKLKKGYDKAMKKAKCILEFLHPNNPEKIAEKLDLFDCLVTKNAKLENFNQKFIQEMGGEHKKECKEKVNEVETGKKPIDVTVDQSKPDEISIKPGVKPDKPLDRPTKSPSKQPSNVNNNTASKTPNTGGSKTPSKQKPTYC